MIKGCMRVSSLRVGSLELEDRRAWCLRAATPSTPTETENASMACKRDCEEHLDRMIYIPGS